MVLAFSCFPRRAFFFEPRFILLDSHPLALRRRPLPFLPARTFRRSGIPVGRARILSLYCLLSRLGWNLFLRQPVFHLAHNSVHPRAEHHSRSFRWALPQSAYRIGSRRNPPLRLHPLECGLPVSVGFALGTGARPNLLAPDDSQSVFHRAAPDFRRSEVVLVAPQGSDGADRAA